ncbi:NADP-dependent oxidoreductase domain-containing protein [Cladochytrium replicatum]|nr:NADP-dependent oxidoreductase domain-containing protein [Cladochytrium replicatum]
MDSQRLKFALRSTQEMATSVKLPADFYVRLGKTGLKVSKICMGCMSLGDPEWQDWTLGREEALPLIKQAYDMGINFFDTADVYSNGASEGIIGDAIKKFDIPRENVVIATKVFWRVSKDMKEAGWFPVPTDSPSIANQGGLSRKHLFEAAEASLKRLQTEYIDLLQIHRWDYDTPIEETMEALNDLVHMGKVRYLGGSSMYAWQFAKANAVADKKGWAKFVSMQNFQNLLYREEEREMNPYCVDAGVGLIPYSPLAGGVLSLREQGTSARSSSSIQGYFYASLNDGDREILKHLKEVSDRLGKKASEVAIAWLLAKPGITAPIIGVSKIKHVEEAIAATHIKLSEEDVKYLEEPYQPKNVIAHS